MTLMILTTFKVRYKHRPYYGNGQSKQKARAKAFEQIWEVAKCDIGDHGYKIDVNG